MRLFSNFLRHCERSVAISMPPHRDRHVAYAPRDDRKRNRDYFGAYTPAMAAEHSH